jgi:rhamnose transport system permease protein
VVTLGTLYVFRGIDYTWATGKQINAADMPSGFLRMGTKAVLGVPVLALFVVVVVVVAGYYMRSFRSGRELYAIGSEPAAARLSGIPVGRRIFGAFVVSGALAGLAGVLYAARFGTLDANAGINSELNVVAAVVVGGVAIFGGSGSVYGAALGAVLLTTIGAALPVLGVSPFWQRAAVGALILAAIGLDRVLMARVAAQLRVAGGRSTLRPAGDKGRRPRRA